MEKIALRPEEALILDTLRLIEPRIEAFRTRGGVLAEAVPSTSPLLGREGIIVKIRDVAEPIPIGSLGEGVYRLLALALALVNARGGALLVDEIDTRASPPSSSLRQMDPVR